MVKRVITRIVAIVLLIGIVVTHPLASFEREDISILLITHYESDEQGIVRPRVADYQSRSQQAAEVSELLQNQKFRRGFTFKPCYPEISISFLLGEGGELYTVNIAYDGIVQVNEIRGMLSGGGEAAESLIAALLPYIPAETAHNTGGF